jgi:hypothetical protein
MVNNPNELVSRGGNCLGFAEFPSDAPKQLTAIIFHKTTQLTMSENR